jgi:hypothetical protein
MQDANSRTLPLDPNIKLLKKSQKELHTVVPETVFPFMKVVGTLLHLVNCTKPDLAHAVGMLCKFNSAPGPSHMCIAAAKGVLRYPNGTRHLGISYTSTPTPLQGYSDANYAGDLTGRKSTTGWIWCKNGGPIAWQSRLQSVVAQSTCEAEYYGAGSATKEALWLRRILKDFGLPIHGIPIYTDNQASVSLLKNGAVSLATEHIDIIYHAVRDSVLRNHVAFSYISTTAIIADFLTKALDFLTKAKIQTLPQCYWHAPAIP